MEKHGDCMTNLKFFMEKKDRLNLIFLKLKKRRIQRTRMVYFIHIPYKKRKIPKDKQCNKS